jgi:hypothetical protein
LADIGMRIRLTFNNVGAGVHFFVHPCPIDRLQRVVGFTPQPPSPVPAGIVNGKIELVQADHYESSPPGYTTRIATSTVAEQAWPK